MYCGGNCRSKGISKLNGIDWRRENITEQIQELIEDCENAGMDDAGIAATVLYYCQENGITLQQLEQDEPHQ